MIHSVPALIIRVLQRCQNQSANQPIQTQRTGKAKVVRMQFRCANESKRNQALWFQVCCFSLERMCTCALTVVSCFHEGPITSPHEAVALVAAAQMIRSRMNRTRSDSEVRAIKNQFAPQLRGIRFQSALRRSTRNVA